MGAGRRALRRAARRQHPAAALRSAAVFLIAALGIGLLISVASPTQQTAMTLAMLASQLPTILLSGFIFPIRAMPAAGAVPDQPDPRPPLPGDRPRRSSSRGSAWGTSGRRCCCWPASASLIAGAGLAEVQEEAVTAMNLRRMLAIVRKEFIQLRRDPQMLRIVFISPLFQLFVFGYAVTTDVRHVATGAARPGPQRPRAASWPSASTAPATSTSGGGLGGPGRGRRAARHRARPGRCCTSPRASRRDLARGAHRAGAGAHRRQRLDDRRRSSPATPAGSSGEYSAQVAAERLDRLRARIDRVPAVEERLRVWYNPELKSVQLHGPRGALR